MRLHLISFPHTQTVKDGFFSCAYTQKTRKLATMLSARGLDVVLYAGARNDAVCSELVKCVSRREQRKLAPDWRAVSFDAGAPCWQHFNRVAVKQLRRRVEREDAILLTGGVAHAPIAEAFPEHLIIEPGVGYGGVLESSHRVFESYAWQAAVYGGRGGAHAADGRFFDAVIPNFFEADDFPAGRGDGDYVLYIGRLEQRKGVEIAATAAQRAGVRLVVAGEGSYRPGYGELVGPVGPVERAALMGGARAVLAPTLYLEPFGGVAAEAQLCGTPAVTTDWGAFPEVVEQGVSGWRCRTLGEFEWAIEHAGELDRVRIRARALALYSTRAVAPMYERFFEHVRTLFGAGWYDATRRRPMWGLGW